jgi:FkbM family methyltransferase
MTSLDGSEHRRPLIVDVGMSTGEDTEFYLAKGFRVLAIEANPDLVSEVGDRLRQYITDGRLTIVHAAVAETPGELEFHISEDAGWSSVNAARAGSALNVPSRSIRVPAERLDLILNGHGTPYYVKIDIEGADAVAVRALQRLPAPPTFVSFESDLLAPDETIELLDLLVRLGYRRFKLVNQALNETLRCPDPPLEGAYVDVRFSGQMSGPFGKESPGDWVDRNTVRDQFLEISRRQAARASYAETGRVLGVPMGRLHRQLKWAYNVKPVKILRTRWASWRGTEVGGWFDIHAGM